MRSASSRLRALLDSERAAASALSGLADVASAPEVRACLEELRYATTWFCDGLEKRVPRTTRRRSSSTSATAHVGTDPVMGAPTGVDRLRLINRSQRSVLARIDGLLVEGLDPELRAFLEEARASLARCVTRCDVAIAGLDREREVRREPDESTPGGSS